MDAAKLAWQTFAHMPVAVFHEVVRLREAVFVVEQRCAYQEVDERDPAARHLLLRIDGVLAGYLRLLGGDPPSIGRLLVAPAFRGRGLARRLMREALTEACRCHGATPVRISAQAHLRGFYESLGFVSCSKDYLEDGILHCAMVRVPG